MQSQDKLTACPTGLSQAACCAAGSTSPAHVVWCDPAGHTLTEPHLEPRPPEHQAALSIQLNPKAAEPQQLLRVGKVQGRLLQGAQEATNG